MKRVFGLVGVLVLLVTPCFATRDLVDEKGRKVSVPDHAHRVICLAPSITDAVFALGGGDEVVAITDYVKYPPEALKKPSVGSISNPSVEMILSLHPDLLIAQPGQNDRAAVERLAAFGIPVYVVDPHGLAGILTTLTRLGQALGREPQAAALVAKLQRRIDVVKASVKEKPVVNVFMPVSYDPVITIGKGSFITDIIEAAGGHSITSEIGQEWPHVSMESVIERAPQALLMLRGGKITPEVLKTRRGWDVLPAVKSGRVYYVDKRVDFPSPEAIDALEDLAKQFHP